MTYGSCFIDEDQFWNNLQKEQYDFLRKKYGEKFYDDVFTKMNKNKPVKELNGKERKFRKSKLTWKQCAAYFLPGLVEYCNFNE